MSMALQRGSPKLCLYTVSNRGFASKASSTWIKRHLRDPYVKKAQVENYRSRASYKLIEINAKYNILKPKYNVLDLGSSPGGWSQVAVEKVGIDTDTPLVTAIDLSPMDYLKGVKFLQGNIEDQKIIDQVFLQQNGRQFDTIISDVAPNFSGRKTEEHLQILEMNKKTLEWARLFLRRGGSLCMKTLQGHKEADHFKVLSHHFKRFLRVKPKASRTRSRELFFVGLGYQEGELHKFLRNRKQDEPMTPEEEERYNELMGYDVRRYFEAYLSLCAKHDYQDESAEDTVKRLFGSVEINPKRFKHYRQYEYDDRDLLEEFAKEAGTFDPRDDPDAHLKPKTMKEKIELMKESGLFEDPYSMSPEESEAYYVREMTELKQLVTNIEKEFEEDDDLQEELYNKGKRQMFLPEDKIDDIPEERIDVDGRTSASVEEIIQRDRLMRQLWEEASGVDEELRKADDFLYDEDVLSQYKEEDQRKVIAYAKELKRRKQ